MPRAHNDHNVYILGAGFAQEAGLPLIENFMIRMRDAAVWLEEQSGREREVRAIENVLDFRLKAAGAAYRVPLDVENVEDLFSLASAGARETLASDMALAIGATLDFAQNDHAQTMSTRSKEYTFYQVGVADSSKWTKPANGEPPTQRIADLSKGGQIKGDWYSCPRYEFYAGVMGGYFNRSRRDRSDTIITFNYDLTVEAALRALGVEFSYGLRKPSQASLGLGGVGLGVLPDDIAPMSAPRVLKLHGSVNWAMVGESAPKLTFCGSYRNVREQDLVPALAPPTWRKGFDGQLGDVWEAAVRSLETATRVIILGYSIPQTDLHFKYLLGAGLQENISLRKVFFVNPGLAREDEADQLKDRLFSVLGEQHFKRGLIELVPLRTSDFFVGPKGVVGLSVHRESIGRPLPVPSTTTGEYTCMIW